jgi:hypothetical protein
LVRPRCSTPPDCSAPIAGIAAGATANAASHSRFMLETIVPLQAVTTQYPNTIRRAQAGTRGGGGEGRFGRGWRAVGNGSSRATAHSIARRQQTHCMADQGQRNRCRNLFNTINCERDQGGTSGGASPTQPPAPPSPQHSAKRQCERRGTAPKASSRRQRALRAALGPHVRPPLCARCAARPGEQPAAAAEQSPAQR